MQKLQMKATPEKIEFEIEKIYEGDFVDGLEFYIEKLPLTDDESSPTDPDDDSAENASAGIKINDSVIKKPEMKSGSKIFQ